MTRGLVSAAALLLTVGCGVGTYRAAQVTGEMQMRLVASEGGEPVTRWSSDEALGLEETIFLDASHVREAHLENLPDGDRHIVLYLTADGADRLAEATRRENEGRRLAIVVDGRIVTAPTIREPITTGEAHIIVDDIDEVFEALTRARQ
jgi:preprotein translocase subunit SecD